MGDGKSGAAGLVAAVFFIGLFGGFALLGSIYIVIRFDKPIVWLGAGLLASAISYFAALLVKPSSPVQITAAKGRGTPFSDVVSGMPDTALQGKLLRQLWGVAYWTGVLFFFEGWFITSARITLENTVWTVVVMAAPVAGTLRILWEFRVVRSPSIGAVVETAEFLNDHWFLFVVGLPAAAIGIQRIFH